MIFTYSEALDKSKTYFNGNDLAAKVFVDKYALRDNDGNILESTPDMTHDRLATAFAEIDAKKYNLNYEERFKVYRDSMHNFARIVPQGSPMSAIGNTYQKVSASNCVVIESPEDSMAGILNNAKDMAQLYKRRCGVGQDISSLRPEGMGVNNAARTTSGAWSFSDLYSYITRMVGQSSRRGALMLTLDVHHPDVEKFATMKHDLSKVTGANVSIKLSDEFLIAVEEDGDYEQRWPVIGVSKFSRKVSARKIWGIIVDSATRTAEPGLLFWDTTIRENPASSYDAHRAISTNPCSEISLSAFDSCRLISLNLTGYIRSAFQKDANFDFDLFEQDIRTATQMSDNLVDIELDLIAAIKDVCDGEDERALWQKLYNKGLSGRRTGLGTHGLGDTLAQLRLKYDSDEAIDVVNKIYETLRNVAYDEGAELAKIRGPFPDWDWSKEMDNSFIKRLPPKLVMKIADHGRRNVAQLTQAPTGSISIVSKCGEFPTFNISSGVEPVFRNFYTRRKKINHGDSQAHVDFIDGLGDKWQEFTVYHDNVQNYMKMANISDMSDLPDFFITSDQIKWQRRIKIQGVEQQYIDHSISSTINLPRGTSPYVVGQIYLEAWKSGLKGITVYVDGSRDGVLIAAKEIKDGRPAHISYVEAPKRLDALPCDIHYTTVNGHRWIALIGKLDKSPYELFIGRTENLQLPTKYRAGQLVKRGKSKYDLHVNVDDETLIVKDVVSVFDNKEAGWATRMISMSLRHGVALEFICDQLSKDGNVSDLNKAISRILKKYIPDGTIARSDKTCDRCGTESIVYRDSCKTCMSCGWSKCD